MAHNTCGNYRRTDTVVWLKGDDAKQAEDSNGDDHVVRESIVSTCCPEASFGLLS